MESSRAAVAFHAALVATALPWPTPLVLDPAQRMLLTVLVLVASIGVWREGGGWRALGLFVAIAMLACFPRLPILGLAPIASAAACLLLAAGRSPRSSGLFVADSAVLLLMALRWASPWVLWTEEWALTARADLASALGWTPALIGWSYMDLAWFGWCACAVLFSGPSNGSRRLLWAALTLGCGVIAASAALTLMAATRDRVPCLEVALMGRLLGLAFVVATCSRPHMPSLSARASPVAIAVALLLLAPAAVALTLRPVDRGSGPVAMAILDRGLSDPSVATYERFDQFSMGMFGDLPLYAARDGLRLERRFGSERFGPEELASYDAMIVINDGEPWREGELAALRGFLRRGGGVLVLCDHTDVVGQQTVVNELTHAHGISLRFDSAYPHGAPSWVGSLELPLHASTIGVGVAEVAHSVGASLEVGPPAVPILCGRFALSDAGVRENSMGAFLGDYRYQHPERRGDLVLAAAADVGLGRLVVVGDTSAFQNASLTRFGGFARSLLRYVGGRRAFAGGAWARMLSQAALLLALLLLLGSARHRRSPGLQLLGVVGAAAFLCLAHRAAGEAPPVDPSAGIDPSIVVVETAGGRDAPGHAHAYAYAGQGHLLALFARNGLQPYTESLSGAPHKPGLVVVESPARALPLDLQRRIVGHVEQGGHLLLATSFAARHRVSTLLEASAIELENVRAPAAQATWSALGPSRAPCFRDAGTVKAGPGVETLVKQAGHSIVTRTRRGAGSIVVIADPHFLSNASLDVDREGGPANNLFITGLLVEMGLPLVPRLVPIEVR